MFEYNTLPITEQDINKYCTVPILTLNYSNQFKFNIDKNLTDEDYIKICNQLQISLNTITFILSIVSTKLHKFQKGDESLNEFINNGWKKTIINYSNETLFIFPEKFTQQFIDSKQGKRFKNKSPCAHMFKRALQSQKTIMEQLQANEV